MIQKRPDEAHAVHWQELVASSRRHVCGECFCRCSGGAGQKHVQVWHPFVHLSHEAWQGKNLADAHGMHPNEHSGGPGQRRSAKLLEIPGRIFPAAVKAPLDVAAGERMRDA